VPRTHGIQLLALANARASNSLLSQYLMACPSCRKSAAIHLDESDIEPVLVRIVCPDSCVVDAKTVLAQFSAESARLTA
jgi:hypothetical protein